MPPSSTMGSWCVAAVCGVTCGGKTTVARRLHAAHPGSVLLSQDDYFLPEDDPRHVRAPGVNHFNWDTLTALDMDKMVADVRGILATPPARPSNDESAEGKTPSGCGEAGPRGLLILEGFLVLNDSRLRELCDVRVFVTLDRETCWARRQLRSYEPPDVPGYFDACVWPMYEKHLGELRREGGQVTFLDGTESLDALYDRVEKEVQRAMGRCGDS